MSFAFSLSSVRQIVRAGLIGTVVSGLGLAVLPGTDAVAARSTMQAPVALPGAIEAMPSYDPATICSPTAKPGAVKLMNLLLRTYPSSRSLGISRACGAGGKSEHKEGRALDWGNRVTNASERANVEAFTKWATGTDANGNRYQGVRRLGIMYMIFNDRIWSASNPEAGWRPYLHPACSSLANCNATLRHRDHLHISLTWAGARGETSFWTGKVGSAGVGSSHATRNQTRNSASVGTWKATVLRNGSRGSAVTAIQKAMRLPQVTGNFGPITTASVKKFQRAHRLPVTGVVASMTWGAVEKDLRGDSVRIAKYRRTLKKGNTGPAVKVLEKAINRPIDGRYTTTDIKHVKIFQRTHGIKQTGIVSVATWNALRGI